jgi:NADH pyrophosphatase NudC (nudix superfamily)
VSVSGHVTYPQTYRKALKREVMEEIGLKLTAYKSMGKILYEDEKEKEFGQVFFGISDKPRIMFDKTEISEVDWVPVEKLRSWSVRHPLTPAAIQVLTEMKVW